MKKNISVFLIFSALLFLWSCSKNDYSVRFSNSYKEGVYNVAVGNAKFGHVDTGKITDYVHITTKSFLITGTTFSGQQLSSSGAISGKGKHKWTVTLTSAGGITVLEDPI